MGTDIDATVLVKLGSDSDNTLEADAPTLAQAIAMAELAIGNLDLGSSQKSHRGLIEV